MIVLVCIVAWLAVLAVVAAVGYAAKHGDAELAERENDPRYLEG